jgi:DNA polymerase
MKHVHLDFETFSEAELKDVGAYRYANDPSTEILCAAMALGDEEPVVWDQSMWCDSYSDKMREHMAALEDPSVLIYCHNAMFEMAICQALLQKTWGIPCPDPSRFRCTMSLARRAALPAKLETLATTLGLTNLKDNRGKALIKKFSVMQPAKKPTKKNPEGLPVRRIRPEDEPEAFAEFCEYCRQDVRVEQEVARKLAYFDEPINNANYSLDAVINARGVPVNLKALRHAQKLIDEETALVSARFRELCGFEVTQGARLLEWLKGEGVDLPDLQAETIENFLEEHDL